MSKASMKKTAWDSRISREGSEVRPAEAPAEWIVIQGQG